MKEHEQNIQPDYRSELQEKLSNQPDGDILIDAITAWLDFAQELKEGQVVILPEE